jgi:sodium/bile acid cotransporter 7
MASQKSAPVAVTVITNVTNDLTQQGLLAIPAIVSQLSQIFIGSLLVGPLSGQAAAWQGHKIDGDATLVDLGAKHAASDTAAQQEIKQQA